MNWERFSYTDCVKNLRDLLRHYRFRLLVVLFVFMAVDLGMLIVVFEASDVGANIKSVEDGIWWAVTTMTGVGYGDIFPVTTAGRIVGMALQIIGLLVFAMIVGYVAVALFSSRDQYYWRKLDKRLDELEQKIDRLSRGQKYLVGNGKTTPKRPV